MVGVLCFPLKMIFLQQFFLQMKSLLKVFIFKIKIFERKLGYCSYKPKHSRIESHLDSLSEFIDSLSSKYDNFILLGDH